MAPNPLSWASSWMCPHSLTISDSWPLPRKIVYPTPLAPSASAYFTEQCCLDRGGLGESALSVELEDERRFAVVVLLGGPLLEGKRCISSLVSDIDDESRVDVPVVEVLGRSVFESLVVGQDHAPSVLQERGREISVVHVALSRSREEI